MTTWLMIFWFTSGANGPVEVMHREMLTKAECLTELNIQIAGSRQNKGMLNAGGQCIPFERAAPRPG